MTREELKAHCEKQIEWCEMRAISKGEKPSGKVYEERKLILELLEQEPVIDKIRAEIERLQTYVLCKGDTKKIELADVLEILDKYKADRSEEE